MQSHDAESGYHCYTIIRGLKRFFKVGTAISLRKMMALSADSLGSLRIDRNPCEVYERRLGLGRSCQLYVRLLNQGRGMMCIFAKVHWAGILLGSLVQQLHQVRGYLT